MDSLSIFSLGSAFIAGLASFLSPCVLPLVPAYVGYLGGRSAFEDKESDQNRWSVFTHGLAFVIGFSVIFILLGLGTSTVASLLYDVRYDEKLNSIFMKVSGSIVIIFGLHMTGILRIPFLQYDTRKQTQPDQNRGYISSFLMGIFFSWGWSPCVGPILGAILTLNLSSGNVFTGGTLLAAYSAGLAIPFLIAALGIGWVTTTLRKYGKALHYLEIAMGVILIIVGNLLFWGLFERITIYLTRFGSLFNNL